MRQRRTKSRRAGLTLIEFLIVVGIILILASILTPKLITDGPIPFRAECLSNIRCIGQNMHMYANDHADHYPVFPLSASGQPDYQISTTNASFGALIDEKHFNDPKAFLCRSFKRAKPPICDFKNKRVNTENGGVISYVIVLSHKKGIRCIPATTDPGENILLMEDPGRDGDPQSFGEGDNHGVDGLNVYRINGLGQFYRGTPVNGVLPLPQNKDVITGELFNITPEDLIRQEKPVPNKTPSVVA